ncbi:MAG: NAD(+) synthase [Cyanobacteria bacterium]|nr:NAD(+) synthase [Cyanobacteriota bacterium]
MMSNQPLAFPWGNPSPPPPFRKNSSKPKVASQHPDNLLARPLRKAISFSAITPRKATDVLSHQKIDLKTSLPSSLLDLPLEDLKKTLETFTQGYRLSPNKIESQLEKQHRFEAITALTGLLDVTLQTPGHPSQQSLSTLLSKKKLLLEHIQQLTGPRGQGNVAIAQINFTVGDLLGNARKIMNYIEAAEESAVDTVVFPEQPLTGWPLGDLIEFYPQFVEDQLKLLQAIASKTKHTRVMMGFIEPRYQTAREPGQQKKFFNAMAILGNGQIEGITRKVHPPTYGEFYEGRQLEGSPSVGVHPPETLRSSTWGSPNINIESPNSSNSGTLASIHGIQYAPSICEDIWADPALMKRSPYSFNPIEALSKLKPDVLVNVSASPSRAHKESQRHHLLSQTADKWNVPLVYVNAIGGNDDLVYEGASRVYNAQGELIARAKSFEEQFLIVNPKEGLGCVFHLPNNQMLPPPVHPPRTFDPEDQADLPRTYQSAKLAIRDYFHKNGYQKAVLGVSGGIDSAVAATLAVDALGAKNVLGVFMPSTGITQDTSGEDAKALCENLKIPLIVMPIGGVLTEIWKVLTPAFEQISKYWDNTSCAPLTNQNNQARIRSIFLRAITNQYGKVLNLGTSDKSEAIIGNGTIAGDMSSDFAVLKDMTKLKINALARWINQYENQNQNKNENHPPPGTNIQPRIPLNTITKAPTAELDKKPGSTAILTDEERYGSTFLLRDEALYQLLRGSSMKEIVASPLQADIQEALSPQDKELAMERFFYHLAKNGIFKWGHLAKGPIMDEKGFTSGELQIPIVAGVNVPWGGLKEEDIATALTPSSAFQPISFPERVTQRLIELGILKKAS